MNAPAHDAMAVEAAELVRFDVAATLGLLECPEHASLLRSGELTWAAVMELLLVLQLHCALYQRAMLAGAVAAVRFASRGESIAAAQALATARGQHLVPWLDARRDELHAPECSRCGCRIDDSREGQTSTARAHELGWQHDAATDRWDCGCPATEEERAAAFTALLGKVEPSNEVGS